MVISPTCAADDTSYPIDQALELEAAAHPHERLRTQLADPIDQALATRGSRTLLLPQYSAAQ